MSVRAAGRRLPPCRPLAFALLVTTAAGRVRPSELNALMYLYNQSGGASWLKSEHWDDGNDPCRKLGAPVPYRGAAARSAARSA